MKSLFSIIAVFCAISTLFGQDQQPLDSLEGKKVILDEVFVSAIRVDKETPGYLFESD